MKISKKVSIFLGGLFTISLVASVFCCGVKADESTILDESNVTTQSALDDESASKSNCDQQQLPSEEIQKINSIRLLSEKHGLNSGNIIWSFEDCFNNMFEKHRKFMEEFDLEVKKLIDDSKNTIGDSKNIVIINYYNNSDKNDSTLSSDNTKTSEETSNNCDASESSSDDISDQITEWLSKFSFLTDFVHKKSPLSIKLKSVIHFELLF